MLRHEHRYSGAVPAPEGKVRPQPTLSLLGIAFVLFGINQLLQWSVLIYLEKGFLDFCQFDCWWYREVMQGYDYQPTYHDRGDAANWAFFPLFPLVARGVHLVSGWEAVTVLVVMGKTLFFLSIFAFIRFATALDERTSPWLAGAVLALNPYSLYGNAGYSEPLFLLLSILAFQGLTERRYVTSGLWGALLSATRPVGIVLAPAYLVTAIQDWRRDKTQGPAMALGLMLIPAGLALFMAFLYFRTGDALAFSHIQVAWKRVAQNPWNHLVEFSRYHTPQLLCVFFAIGTLAWRRRFDLAVFSLFATLIPLSTGLWAMPRYIWWQLPVLLVLLWIVSIRKLWLVYVPVSGALFLYVNHAWLKGEQWLM